MKNSLNFANTCLKVVDTRRSCFPFEPAVFIAGGSSTRTPHYFRFPRHPLGTPLTSSLRDRVGLNTPRIVLASSASVYVTFTTPTMHLSRRLFFVNRRVLGLSSPGI